MEEKVFNTFNHLNIPYECLKHPALFTCLDDKKYNLNFDAVVCKNLFLRNRNKSQFYLLSLPIDKKIDLKKLQQDLNETKLSFASENSLKEKLKISSGSVSILNIIEVEKTDVIFLIDSSLLLEKKVGFHPNVNTKTITFSPIKIEKILQYYDTNYKFITI